MQYIKCVTSIYIKTVDRFKFSKSGYYKANTNIGNIVCNCTYFKSGMYEFAKYKSE